jgi:hypothetical protein
MVYVQLVVGLGTPTTLSLKNNKLIPLNPIHRRPFNNTKSAPKFFYKIL